MSHKRPHAVRRAVSALLAIPLGFVAALSLADIDLSDFDDDLMQGMDDSIKSFEPNIAAGNAERALADAQILWDGFKWTEEYFKSKNAEDAVQISKEALQHTSEVMKSLQAKDFDAAMASARRAARTCRTCHDIYKPS